MRDSYIENGTKKYFNKKAAELMERIRMKKPLIHQITNYVTVNDCANITLAVGASPIMADDIEEAAEITSISSALVINIGTLNERTASSMIASGKRANELGIPVIFDPVGAGASLLRNRITQEILDQIRITILRGNLSEISFAAGQSASTRGVDVSEEDRSKDGIAVAKSAAKKYQCTAAITGAVDILSNGERTVMIENGHPMLAQVTGTGCMSTALTASFAGIETDYLAAAVSGITVMGIAGEIAFEQAGSKGTGSFRTAIIDAVSGMDKETIEKRAKIYEV